VPAVEAQRLEKDHRSAGEHLKGSTKELQPVRFIGVPTSVSLCRHTQHGE